ncbi:hypothetical protein BCU00_000430 [Vibrio breoganii]|uniref:hypothetical protein n=1 Tax=Vibrio breoganii TaxID=553239 RepID=UPI000C82FE49|nr:hypothetical protein [Vibrio breoganii]PMK47746.1 hypothetical protein BCU00_05260 [Vibrio breoganii]PMO35195.1 hypothetical protein BCT12_00535 [Vibrio breoganii]PMO56792.1 hypothetical protein BCT07_13990 [Vibrio breoganii]
MDKKLIAEGMKDLCLLDQNFAIDRAVKMVPNYRTSEEKQLERMADYNKCEDIAEAVNPDREESGFW